MPSVAWLRHHRTKDTRSERNLWQTSVTCGRQAGSTLPWCWSGRSQKTKACGGANTVRLAVGTEGGEEGGAAAAKQAGAAKATQAPRRAQHAGPRRPCSRWGAGVVSPQQPPGAPGADFAEAAAADRAGSHSSIYHSGMLYGWKPLSSANLGGAGRQRRCRRGAGAGGCGGRQRGAGGAAAHSEGRGRARRRPGGPAAPHPRARGQARARPPRVPALGAGSLSVQVASCAKACACMCFVARACFERAWWLGSVRAVA